MWIKRAILLILLCLLMGLFAFETSRLPSLLQYAFLPGANLQPASNVQDAGDEEPEESAPLSVFLEGWDTVLEGQQGNYAAAVLSAHLPHASMSTLHGGNAVGELTALVGDLHALEPKVLVFGRQLYQEEADEGRAVAVVDEGLAIALFRQGNPVDLTFELLGQEFKVVGVVRHTRSLGDRAEYGLSVPLKAFRDQPAWEMLAAHLSPVGGSGTRLALAGALSRWQPGGQAIDLVKEKYRTLLPLRFLLCAAALWLLRVGLSAAVRVSSRLIADSRERLKSGYALRLMPRFILAGLAIALMFAAGIGLIFYVLSAFIAPVYIFPEWVPTILVEPREIAATFWDNRTAVTGLVSLRTRELLMLQTLRSILTALAIASGAMLVTPLHYLRRQAKKLR